VYLTRGRGQSTSAGCGEEDEIMQGEREGEREGEAAMREVN